VNRLLENITDNYERTKYSRRRRKRPKLPVILAAAVFILFILILILHGCSDDPSDKIDPAAGSDTEAAEDSSDTIHVGGIGYGYLEIPNGWKDFNDSQLTQGGDMYVVQFSDADSNCVLTLNYTDTPQVDAQTAASSIWAQMEKEGAEAIQGSTVTLADCEAYQVYGYYKDDKIMLVTWSFTDANGLLHFISAEGPLDRIADVVSAVENTYVIEE